MTKFWTGPNWGHLQTSFQLSTKQQNFRPVQIERLSRWQENLNQKLNLTLGKGENTGYQHFLLFPQCFQKASFLESLKVRIVWQRVKCDWYDLFLSLMGVTTLQEKGENAHYQHFHHLPQCFPKHSCFISKCFRFRQVNSFVVWYRVKSFTALCFILIENLG